MRFFPIDSLCKLKCFLDIFRDFSVGQSRFDQAVAGISSQGLLDKWLFCLYLDIGAQEFFRFLGNLHAKWSPNNRVWSSQIVLFHFLDCINRKALTSTNRSRSVVLCFSLFSFCWNSCSSRQVSWTSSSCSGRSLYNCEVSVSSYVLL